MNASAFDLNTIVGCLDKADEFIGSKVAWQSVNDQQAWLLGHIDATRQGFNSLPEMNAWAAETAEEINAIAQEHGFSIRLTPWPEQPGKFGILAIMDVQGSWLAKGNTFVDGKKLFIKEKPAFQIDFAPKFFRVPGSENPAVVLGTDKGDSVFFTKCAAADFQVLVDSSLQFTAAGQNPQNATTDWDAVRLPMIKMDVENDLSWLVELNGFDADGNQWFIEEAMQQLQVGMNQRGFRARAATMMAASTLSLPPQPRNIYVFEESFLMWAMRPGMKVPLFVAHCPESCWEDPGDLATLGDE